MEVSTWLVKGFAFTALLVASSSAADCSIAAGSCRDETSLLQVHKAVKLGLERSEDGQRAHVAQDPGKPWVMGNVGMPGAPASQPLMVELPGGGLGWVAPNDMRVVNAVPGADGMMYQPGMAQSVLAGQATPQNFVPVNAAFGALPPNMPPMGYRGMPQGIGYGGGLPGTGPDPLAMQAPDPMFAAGMPRSEEQRELEPQVVLPGDAQRARNTQHELASLQGLGMPQIGFGPDGLARLEVPGAVLQGRKAGAALQFQAPDQDELASVGISGAVPAGTGAMLAPELGRLGLPQGAATADMQPPGGSAQMQPGLQYQYMLPGANTGALPQGAMPGSVMMGVPQGMPPGMQPFAMDGLGNTAVPASGMMPLFPQDAPAQFQIDPSMIAPATHPAMPRVEQQADQDRTPGAPDATAKNSVAAVADAQLTDKAAELTDKMASETEEVVDKAVARAMEVLKAKKQEAALAEATMKEAGEAQKKMLAEKAKKAAVRVGSQTRMEMASEEQQFAEKAAKMNAAAENRQRAVAKQAAEKAAAEKVASAAQKAVAKSAARTAAAEQAAAAAEKVVADLGPA